MPALIVYLLKVNVALCLFYLAYRFALRPLTFYYLNRFFLVFGIVFSTLYPLVDLSALFARHTVIRQQLTTIVPNWHAVMPAVQHQVETVSYWEAPIILFWIGVVLMALRLIVQFVSLYRIHRSSEQAHHLGHSFRAVRSEINPFSFWQDIYLNPDKHTDSELRAIIQHEQVHVKQWHSLDVILAELSVVFYWFNPGVWFMKQAVKENLEFITDREILRSGMDEKVYQYSLVRVSALKPGAAIVNNFNFLTIKKRIMMMNKKRSSRANLTRYVVLPLVMLLALIFTVSKAEITNKSISILVKKILPVTVTEKPSHGNKPIVVAQTRDTNKLTLKIDTAKKYTIIQINRADGVDTIIERDTLNRKAVRTIRINSRNISTDGKKDVLVIDDKGKAQNLSLSNVSPDQIESIRVVSDSAKSFTSSGSGPAAVVVQLKPLTHVSTFSTGVSSSSKGYTAVSVAFANDAAPKTVTLSVDDNDDKLIYIIDPKNLNLNEVEKMRNTFKENGFDLNVHEDYNGKTLKRLNIKISSESKNQSSSVTSSYSNDDMRKVDYMIKIVADKTTGEVAVMSVKG